MTIREFEIQFRKLYLPLGMYALRIVEDIDNAEDLVEDAFLKAWEAIENGTEIVNFNSFIYRTVRNNCISFLRKQHEFVGIESIPEVDEESVDTSFRDARVWKAVDALPEKCREVFLMSKRDGLSNEEIAEELHISINTVKNHLSKALSRLRDALSPGYKPFFLPFL